MLKIGMWYDASFQTKFSSLAGKNGPPDHFGPILVDQVKALLF